MLVTDGKLLSSIFKQVLNAGKNKLRSMDEVRSLVSLRALILNGGLYFLDTKGWIMVPIQILLSLFYRQRDCFHMHT